jgi:hypothetical protein
MNPHCYCCGSPASGTLYLLTGDDGTIRLLPVCSDCRIAAGARRGPLRSGHDLIADRAAHHPNPNSAALGHVIGAGVRRER